MEPEGSLQCSQEPIPDPEPDEFIPLSETLFHYSSIYA
jgi:hypothetical protein